MTQKGAKLTTKSSSAKQPDAPFSFSTLGLDLLDTTWRIATPVVIFAGAGIFADIKLGTKPWVTLGGMVVGFVAAGFLLKQQLDRVEKRDSGV